MPQRAAADEEAGAAWPQWVMPMVLAGLLALGAADGLGVPVVAGFCAGEAVGRLVDGRPDDEVAALAVLSLLRFTDACR